MRTTWLALILFLALLVVLGSTTPACTQDVDKDRIDRAVNYAVAFLKKNQAGPGFWVHNGGGPEDEYNVGATALVGLALLESDVPRDDRALAGAANIVRGAIPRLTLTYTVSLAILFLDRYRGGKDPELVRRLALRLAAAQNQADGGWGYNAPALSPQAEATWMANLKRLKNAKNVQGNGQQLAPGTNSDNSNTQFAVLALWVARVHDIPVDYCLLLAEWHFRTTQHSNGGWNYGLNLGGPAGDPATPSMTCAGLLGLAIAYGTKREQAAALRAGGDKLEGGAAKPMPLPRFDIDSDQAVQRAKTYISGSLRKQRTEIPHFLYFLWSLERVSVTYRWKDYDNVDWYAYGSTILLNDQQRDGSWRMESTVNVDTAFALLFLRKANLVGDISGTAVIRSGASDPLKAATGPMGDPTKTKTDKPLKEIAPDKAEAEAKKLSGEFLVSQPAKQREILETLQDTKDSTGNFTQALIDLIPQAKEEQRDLVRRALAERLSRQTLAGLTKRLTDEDAEVRLAVVRAMGVKGDQKAMPELIKLLTNSNEDLAEAAEQSLQMLTDGKDFGRNPQRWTEYFQNLKIRP
jgi:hypothetical protein